MMCYWLVPGLATSSSTTCRCSTYSNSQICKSHESNCICPGSGGVHQVLREGARRIKYPCFINKYTSRSIKYCVGHLAWSWAGRYFEFFGQELSILNYSNTHASHESKTPTLQATYIECFSNHIHESNNIPNHESNISIMMSPTMLPQPRLDHGGLNVFVVQSPSPLHGG